MKLLEVSIAGLLFFVAALPGWRCLEGQLAAESVSAHVSAAGAFSAIKYARLVRVQRDGSLQFIRNERRPSKIGRDSNGKIMMQYDADVPSDCDRPEMRIPPPCPSWSVFVIDPKARVVTHWSEGEFAAHVALEMPLSEENREIVLRLTSEVPILDRDPESDAKIVRTENLGEQVIDGIRASGSRTIVTYPAGHLGARKPTSVIHEVWTAREMELIVRVIDGDPHGLERIWGLEKIVLAPDASLFSPPAGYEMQYQKSDKWASHDFDELKSWFEE